MLDFESEKIREVSEMMVSAVVLGSLASKILNNEKIMEDLKNGEDIDLAELENMKSDFGTLQKEFDSVFKEIASNYDSMVKETSKEKGEITE